jgi:CheY-like chemotaxis protein
MGSRILLADDSITIQKVVNLTFADEGIEVVAVSNGELAERRLADVRPDLVLADIFMPGKNGYELCDAIKQNPEFHNLPVVLLVGAFEPFDQVEARRVRADAHLTKPFESRTLVETVRRLISASWRGTTGPIAPMPVNEERQAARDQESVETPTAPPAASLDTNPDLSAPMTDSGVAPSTPFVRNTGELASPALSAQPEAFQLGGEDAPIHEMAAATLTGSVERADDTGLSSSSGFVSGEMTSEFPLDSQEMILDFDKSEPLEAAASRDKHSFEAEADALLDVDVSGAGEGGDWFSREGLGTTGLDTPAGGWPTSTSSSPLGEHTAGFTRYNEAGFEASETSTETACATLLAVDEPLGDVLFGEALSIDASPQSDVLSSDLPGLDFNEPEVTEPEPMTSTQFDLVHTSEESSTQESGEVLESSAVDQTQTVNASPERVAEAPTVEPHAAVSDLNQDHDWTSPRAGVYSTAQLDPIMMPIAAAEHSSDNSNGSEALKAESTPEASFTTTGTWAEEEARFTAIDIEAVSVEQPEPQPNSADTGFSVLSADGEEHASDVEDRAARSEPAKETATPTDLSSAAIEEIVRRVVAEMSESVVREVAWEVVPDCVERVIEQLTRESLSKRA